jgi:hypothetical protein
MKYMKYGLFRVIALVIIAIALIGCVTINGMNPSALGKSNIDVIVQDNGKVVVYNPEIDLIKKIIEAN